MAILSSIGSPLGVGLGSPVSLTDTLLRLEPGDLWQAAIRSFFMGIAVGAVTDGISQAVAD